ncbi:MAG TPA: hypothetical protein VGO68_07550 [Pyrinomonadaceae bacterium]|jgi:hypothetical protein|nr:hypothetical protein [Pyrinomonadaceae bacterium]
MILELDVLGPKELRDQCQLSYHWEVSGSKILKGQGTPEIAVELSEPPSSGLGVINAKVIVDGGPPEFERSNSCTLKVDPKCARPNLFEQYGGISLKEEEPSLDRLARYLKSEGSASFAFIVVYAGQESCLWEAKWRGNRAKQYLIDTYKIEADRVIAVDGGFRAKLQVDIFTADRESCGPFPTPTVMVSGNHLTGLSCKDKYKETGNP